MGILAEVHRVLVEDSSLSHGKSPLHDIVARQVLGTSGPPYDGIISSVNFSDQDYKIRGIFTPGPPFLPSQDQGTGEDEEASHCGHGALMGPLGLLVQGLLAVIAFSALIGKLSYTMNRIGL